MQLQQLNKRDKTENQHDTCKRSNNKGQNVKITHFDQCIIASLLLDICDLHWLVTCDLSFDRKLIIEKQEVQRVVHGEDHYTI